MMKKKMKDQEEAKHNHIDKSTENKENTANSDNNRWKIREFRFR